MKCRDQCNKRCRECPIKLCKHNDTQPGPWNYSKQLLHNSKATCKPGLQQMGFHHAPLILVGQDVAVQHSIARACRTEVGLLAGAGAGSPAAINETPACPPSRLP